MNIAAIPVKDKLEWTAPLVEHLLLHDDLDQVWIFDNGSKDRTREWVIARSNMDGRLKLVNAFGLRLYEMWNQMVALGAVHKSANLAILNNDIRLPPYAIRDMSLLMRKEGYQIAAVDPARTGLYTYSIGWWAPDRALPEPIEPYCEEQPLGFRIGWAFVIAAEFWEDQPYAVHPSLDVYYGDDDLYRRAMERGGRACVVRGIGSDHAENQSGWERNPDVWEKDKQSYSRLWQ
jgi:GT2 family glycosyltransferase